MSAECQTTNGLYANTIVKNDTIKIIIFTENTLESLDSFLFNSLKKNAFIYNCRKILKTYFKYYRYNDIARFGLVHLKRELFKIKLCKSSLKFLLWLEFLN